jgi:hypothetical protein
MITIRLTLYCDGLDTDTGGRCTNRVNAETKVNARGEVDIQNLYEAETGISVGWSVRHASGSPHSFLALECFCPEHKDQH